MANTSAQLPSNKFRIWAEPNPARGLLEICDCENL